MSTIQEVRKRLVDKVVPRIFYLLLKNPKLQYPEIVKIICDVFSGTLSRRQIIISVNRKIRKEEARGHIVKIGNTLYLQRRPHKKPKK